MVKNSSHYRFNYSFAFRFILFTLIFQFFFVLHAFSATQVSLEWDPNSEPDLAGYRVFSREQSQSYDYANPSWEGTDTYCIIYDLDETKTYCFVARAFDSYGNESANSVEVCQDPSAIPNQPPAADAGPDQTVSEGQMVSLNGSNSTDPDDGIASYHWVQVGEQTVALSDPDVKQPTFTAPDVGPEGAALTFELTVVDTGGNQAKDTCAVNVTWQNEPPQANAGLDQTVNEGSVVTLNGTLSLDIDDGITSYLWTQTGGPTISLSNPALSQPTFTAPKVESDGASLTFNLTVTDTGGLQNTDSCIVNISWQNEPPAAVVTPDYAEAAEETLVRLDGSASTDSDDGISSYQWTQIEGDPVSLSEPTSAVTTFKAPKTDRLGKNLKFKLTVKDVGGLQGTADSTIYVTQNILNNIENNPPAADFTYDTRRKRVTFTDRSIDSDGTIVSWYWDFGDGSTGTGKNPSHWYREFGTYTVTLTVVDDQGDKNTQSKTVTLSTETKR
ncbi:MAG: PKD domain-containing protein, partial [Desulfobacterales bacterium]